MKRAKTDHVKAIKLQQKLGLISEHWSPRVIAELNDYQFKLVRIQGEFVWHDHPDTDEAFLCLEGEMSIHFRKGRVDLCAGDLYVVPRGVEHKPVARNECCVMLIEPRGVVNTGDAGGDLTAESDVWL
jgi:mannose-6-phosphate isomerase-like protein (cupin superfamily)